MDALTCGICLDQLKIPVSTPCGHLCCEACLTSYIEASADALNASCPTCRATFSIVVQAIPDLRFVPKKYHSLILPSIRRVFISSNAIGSGEVESQRELRAEVARLTDKIDALVHDKALLMDRCEAAIRASQAHAQGERDERLAKEHLERELRDLRKKYDTVKGKYKMLKTTHENTVVLGATKHMKRTSSQAALDSFSYSASSSTESLNLPAVPERELVPESSAAAHRPILRIPKRPRLLGSPFDLSKRIESREATMSSRTRHFDDSDRDDEDEESGLRSSDLSSSVGSSSGPQRSGLPEGDIFSPRSRDGGRSALFAHARRSGAGTVFNGGWLLSPEDAH
ncbi:hypothetical protein BN946_scf184805.g56 [Trametes cinnabarina]|uniref:RING-type domain-containing protein n=1 Tax=Pycnoporus cinnabarinus TaxID=5643 RepID=A0A060S382_PYCCI|nr:hypothetical protein BN946_scf184805.g56 [Trametes cinnabarina]